MAKIHHHYIPRTYLKQWENQNKQIWLYDIEDRTMELRNKDSIFYEKHLYSITFIESQLLAPDQKEMFIEPLKQYQVFLDGNRLNSEEIFENLTRYDEFVIREQDGRLVKKGLKKSLLEDILSKKHLVIEDKYKDIVEDSWNKTLHFFENFRKMVMENNVLLPEASVLMKYIKRILEFMLSTYTRNPYEMQRRINRIFEKKGIQIDGIRARFLFKQMQLLYLNDERKLYDVNKYDIHLLFTISDCSFITTDCPVVIRKIEIEDMGITGLMWFPISPCILILLSKRQSKDSWNISYGIILDDTVNKINSILIENTNKHFIFPDKKEDMGFKVIGNC